MNEMILAALRQTAFEVADKDAVDDEYRKRLRAIISSYATRRDLIRWVFVNGGIDQKTFEFFCNCLSVEQDTRPGGEA